MTTTNIIHMVTKSVTEAEVILFRTTETEKEYGCHDSEQKLNFYPNIGNENHTQLVDQKFAS